MITFFTVLMCWGISVCYAEESYSQSTFLSINAKDKTIKEVFAEIEENSEYIFFYYGGVLDLNRKISINMKDKTIQVILDELFKSTDVEYLVSDRQITLTKKAAATDAGQLAPQQSIITVTGKVVDVENNPIPGVNVVVKGTTRGVITDLDGNYSMDVQFGGTLVFSFIGYTSREVTVGDSRQINITLEEDLKIIDEVIVVGYGTQKKANLTGAVSSMNFESDAITSRSVSNVSTALSGMTSGIRVQQINGLPSENDNASINIRGTGSLNAGSAPLVLIDGQVADFNSVSPNDVKSVSILKDAASSAIYGSRAANGVILITTKAGEDTNGKITVSYHNYFGKSNPANKENLINNTPDYMTLVNMMLRNSNLNEKYTKEYIEEWREGSKTDPIYYPNTDWWDAITKDNNVMNHHLSARGGNSRISFYTSVEYFKNDGLVPNTGYERMNFRNNIDYKVNDWLKLGNNLSLIRTNAEPATIADAFEWFRATTPAVVPKHPDGRYGSGQLPSGEGGANNMLYSVERRVGETSANQLQTKIYAILTPLKGLTITGSFFNDLNQQESWRGAIAVDSWNFQTNQVGIDRTSGYKLDLSNSYSKRTRNIYDLNADYNISFDDHNFKVLVGYNQEEYHNKSFNASKKDLLSYDTPVLDAAASDPQAGGTTYDYAMRSYFGRLNYDYKGKYLFEANLRYDGSSRFAPDSRWGAFPSFSAGWRLSEEEFWDPLKPVVNSFKFRTSWGQLGNNGIGNYEWQSVYSSANYILGGVPVIGLRFNAFGNPMITWETTDVFNAGADFMLFNSLNFDINYYNKFTHNILANTPIPMVNGGITAPRTNSAEVRNSGIEAEARFNKRWGKFSISIEGNFAYNKNRIEKYKGDLIEPHGTNQAWTEGKPIGVYWIREVDHIVQDQSEIDAMIADGFTFHPEIPGVGDFLYKNNNNDKAINDDDRILKGNPIPLYTYGGNIGVKYADLDFSVYFDGVGGWDRYLLGSTYTLNHAEGYQWPKEYLNAWTPENPSTTIPKVYQANTKNDQASDYFLRSSAYLKIRSIQLGYTLPENWLRTIKIDKFRVFVNLENYFTFTSWPAMNPEVGDGADTGYYTYPLTKTASIGFSINF